MRIEFTLEAWNVLMWGRVSGELQKPEPHLRSARTVDPGTGLHYVVDCPETVAHELQDFFYRYEQSPHARARPAAERRQADPSMRRRHPGAAQGLNAVQQALEYPDTAGQRA